jgi:hypothetical protein
MDLNVPVEFLVGASERTLENFELKRLEYAANLEKEAKAMQLEAQQARDAAHVARWLRANRTELLRTVGSHLATAGANSGESALESVELERDPRGQPVADRSGPVGAVQRAQSNAA